MDNVIGFIIILVVVVVNLIKKAKEKAILQVPLATGDNKKDFLDSEQKLNEILAKDAFLRQFQTIGPEAAQEAPEEDEEEKTVSTVFTEAERAREAEIFAGGMPAMTPLFAEAGTPAAGEVLNKESQEEWFDLSSEAMQKALVMSELLAAPLSLRAEEQ